MTQALVPYLSESENRAIVAALTTSALQAEGPFATTPGGLWRGIHEAHSRVYESLTDDERRAFWRVEDVVRTVSLFARKVAR